jgi:hypothetical protein
MNVFNWDRDSFWLSYFAVSAAATGVALTDSLEETGVTGAAAASFGVTGAAAAFSSGSGLSSI